jgi:uncharacterized tellurite resistance protein B-like protein
MSTILHQMRFAPEKEAFNSMLDRFGLDPILGHFEREGGLSNMRDLVLGQHLKLSPMLSPRVFTLLDEVRAALNYREPVDVFVAADADINALAIHSLDGTPHMIVLTSSMLERVDDDELCFVLGHEIGHIQFDHYRMRLLPYAVGKDNDGDPKLPGLLRRKLESWNRLAELSADRAGFAAARGGLRSIVSVFFKIASGLGPEHLRFDIQAFLNQLDELRQLEGRELICGFSHPVTPIRVRALQMFGQAGGVAAAADRLLQLDSEVEELARLMDYTSSKPVERHGRDLLVAGGLLIGHADGEGFSDEESEMLVEMLLPITPDPEAAITGVKSTEQARELLARSAAWLRENAGEERFTVLRYLSMIAAVDGSYHPNEEALLLEIAGLLGIPAAVARKEMYEILARSLQGRKGGTTKVPGMQFAS